MMRGMDARNCVLFAIPIIMWMSLHFVKFVSKQRHKITRPPPPPAPYRFYGEEHPYLRCAAGGHNCSHNLIVNDILSKLPKSLHDAVSGSLMQTGPIELSGKRKCPRISRKMDTTCPYQIRLHSPKEKRTERLPNAIGIGTHKSGTGALSFLDCHPELTIRILEANAYTQQADNKLYYECGQFTLPKTTEYEFLIEKSPLYAERFSRSSKLDNKDLRRQELADLKSGNYETVKRARQMKRTNPNVKLFMFITDPVGRAYSQITQILRPDMKRLRARFKEYETAPEVIKVATDYVLKIGGNTESLADAFQTELEEDNIQLGWYLRILLQIGNYYSTITDYEQVFGAGSVYLVDGHNEITDPNDEFTRLLQFFNVDPTLIDFRFNAEKGFYCLEKPLRFCLSEEKGHRNASFNLFEAYPEMAVLKRGYAAQMTKLYRHIYNCHTTSECCKINEARFKWLKPYFCE